MFTKITNGTSTEEFPTGITAVREITTGYNIQQSLINDVVGTDNYKEQRIQIRVLARYFPKYILNDTDWATTELDEGTYDCATLDVGFTHNGRFYKAGSVEVGAYWNEYIFDTDYFGEGSLTVGCSNKKLQLARIECVLL